MSKSWLVPILAVVLTCWRVGPASAAEEKEQDEQKVAFKHAPSAVRKTLKREANGQKIKTVDKERLNGKLVYEADVMIDGHNYEIVVDPDGLLLSRVETWRGGLDAAYPFPALSVAGASRATSCSVSTSRSSNRTGGFPASGSRRRHHALACNAARDF